MLHNVQGVDMGGMDWLDKGDCEDGGDADIDNGVDGPGMATAGLLVTYIYNISYIVYKTIYITILNTFYGGIIWVWVCQMGDC